MKQNISKLYDAKFIEGNHNLIQQAERELQEYFDRKREKFDLPLYILGTDFELKVWEQLAKIPYGEVKSYKDIAKQINCPRAVRAVGGANGRNHLAIIIPCHRVIGSHGSLTGYGGGMEKKKFLLEVERGTGFL